MKKCGAIAAAAFMVCVSVFLSQGHGYIISLTRNYIENMHYADATLILGATNQYGDSTQDTPHAAVDVRVNGYYASNGRGFADDIIRNNYRVEGYTAWSDATIRFFGESGYSIPGGFGNLAFGNALSHVRYDFMLSPYFGTAGSTEVTFSISEYVNTYDADSGLQLITLKDSGGDSLFSWEGSQGIQDYPVNLNPSEGYSIWIESHGDFSSFGGAAQGAFASDVELVISATELGIPLPPSALLLGVSLVSAFVFRKRLLLSHS